VPVPAPLRPDFASDASDILNLLVEAGRPHLAVELCDHFIDHGPERG
jgi:hypothetical protein